MKTISVTAEKNGNRWEFVLNTKMKPPEEQLRDIKSTLSSSGHNPKEFADEIGQSESVAQVTVKEDSYTVEWDPEVLNAVYWSE